MPDCKFCGESVTAGAVYHPKCGETKIHELAERFCDNFCVWPRVCARTKNDSTNTSATKIVR